MGVSMFDNRRVRQGLTLCMLSGVLACIFPPRHPAFQWWSEQAVFVAVGFLLFGLFFLFINKSRLMFVCLGCSAAISFLKHEMDGPASGGERNPPVIRPVDTTPGGRLYRDSVTPQPVLPDGTSKTHQ